LNAYLQQFKLRIQFTVEEVAHFLLPREWVIESFVVEDDNKVITDFVSFYSLPSSVLKHPDHNILNVAYSYYNVPGKFTMLDLMRDALILARNKGYDVFNALDVQQNIEVMKELNFGVGDGNLHYYLYNWRI
jgi:glycylpeptide N-tetradecanoyltransferase